MERAEGEARAPKEPTNRMMVRPATPCTLNNFVQIPLLYRESPLLIRIVEYSRGSKYAVVPLNFGGLSHLDIGDSAK